MNMVDERKGHGQTEGRVVCASLRAWREDLLPLLPWLPMSVGPRAWVRERTEVLRSLQPRTRRDRAGSASRATRLNFRNCSKFKLPRLLV